MALSDTAVILDISEFMGTTREDRPASVERQNCRRQYAGIRPKSLSTSHVEVIMHDDLRSGGGGDAEPPEPSGDELLTEEDLAVGEIEASDVLLPGAEPITAPYRERLFISTLSMLRKHPELAGIHSVALQAGQSQVVEPVAVNRLVRQVQSLMSMLERSERAGPLSKRVLDPTYPDLSCRQFKPLVYDVQTIYAVNLPADRNRYHTIRHVARREMLEPMFQAFRHPALHRGQKSYDSNTLHREARSSYSMPRVHAGLNVIQLETLVRYFRTPDLIGKIIEPGLPNVYTIEESNRRCIDAPEPERYLDITSNIPVYRVAEDTDIHSLLQHRFIVEERQAHLPVMQAVLDDENKLNIRKIFPGETVCVLGWVVDRGRTLKMDSLEYLKSSNKKDDIAIRKQLARFPSKQFVIICPERLHETVDCIVPSTDELIFNKNASAFRECFNFESADKILSSIRTAPSPPSAPALAKLRARITQNVLQAIDFIHVLRQKNKQLFETKETSRQREHNAGAFHLTNLCEIATHEKLLSEARRPMSDIDFLLELQRVEGADNLLCVLLASKSLREDKDEDQFRAAYPSDRSVDSLDSQGVELQTQIILRDGLSALSTLTGQSITIQDAIRSYDDFRLDQSEEVLQLDTTVKRVSQKVAFCKRRSIISGTETQFDNNGQARGFSWKALESLGDGGETHVYVTDFSQSSRQLALEYTSPQYRQLKMERTGEGGDSIVSYEGSSRLRQLFPSKPLLEIARQIGNMLHSHKLNCKVEPNELLAMVNDINEMNDQDFSSFERRKFLRELIADGVTPEAAKKRWTDETGSSIRGQIKTPRRVAVVLARLLLQLELHRPRHSFRKIFPIGGQKTLGQDTHRSFESFTPESNRFRYMVRVAVQTADMGQDGKLLAQTQETILNDVTALTVKYYDKFLEKPAILAMKAVADRNDAIQTSLDATKSSTSELKGRDWTEVSDLLSRLKPGNQSLQSILNGPAREKRIALHRKLSFLVLTLLIQSQNQVEEAPLETWLGTDSYRLDGTGYENGTACQPGQPCIQNLFVDLDVINQDVRREIDNTEAALQALQERPGLAIFPQRKVFTTYPVEQKGFGNSNQWRARWHGLVMSGAEKLPRSQPRKGHHARENVVQDFEITLQSLADLLAEENKYYTDTSRARLIAFMLDLGNERGEAGRSYGSELFAQSMLRAFRKTISLLANRLRVTTNIYQFGASSGEDGQLGNIDLERYSRGPLLEDRLYVAGHELPKEDILYYNRSENYLSNYLDLSESLNGCMTENDCLLEKPFSAVKVTHGSERTSQTRSMQVLAEELTRVFRYAVKSRHPESRSFVQRFCVDFLEKWFVHQHDNDVSHQLVTDIQNRIYEQRVKEAEGRMRGVSSEIWAFREAGLDVNQFWEAINLEPMDPDEEESDGKEMTLQEDFNIIDDENRMNLFNDDE